MVRETKPTHRRKPSEDDHLQITGLINRLVCEEECNCLPERLGDPSHLSHIWIYRRAMEEIGANTSAIDAVMQRAMTGDIRGAVQHPAIPKPAAKFLLTTKDLIAKGEVDALAVLMPTEESGSYQSSFAL